MNQLSNGTEIPMGLGMALAQNMPAMNHFSNLSHAEQMRIIDRTSGIRSKAEMRSFVSSLADGI